MLLRNYESYGEIIKYFKDTNFRRHKLSRCQKNAKFLIENFAGINFRGEREVLIVICNVLLSWMVILTCMCVRVRAHVYVCVSPVCVGGWGGGEVGGDSAPLNKSIQNEIVTCNLVSTLIEYLVVNQKNNLDDVIIL